MFIVSIVQTRFGFDFLEFGFVMVVRSDVLQCRCDGLVVKPIRAVDRRPRSVLAHTGLGRCQRCLGLVKNTASSVATVLFFDRVKFVARCCLKEQR